MSRGNHPRFFLYVDEAGDDGLKAHLDPRNDLSSEWFVLGGIAVTANDDRQLGSLLNGASAKANLPFGRDVHFARLNDRKRTIICSELSVGRFRWFCVVSDKASMRGYKNDNAAAVSKKNNILYNFMLRVLLERATKYCSDYNSKTKTTNSHDDLRVILSDRGGINCPDLGSYFTRLWHQYHQGGTFLNKSLIDFSIFDPKNINIKPNSEIYGLQISDCIVSAFYKALPQRFQQNPKDEFLNILLPRCASRNGNCLNVGITPLPFLWNKLLPLEKRYIFTRLRKMAASPRLCVPTSELVRPPS